ncbi:hypothetical protein ACFYSF_37065 [Streptomyces canus]|uniref:hypothetical protein n=1 Tax=Streptomyces canus TaxID=58343 RepID=UPI0036881427
MEQAFEPVLVAVMRAWLMGLFTSLTANFNERVVQSTGLALPEPAPTDEVTPVPLPPPFPEPLEPALLVACPVAVADADGEADAEVAVAVGVTVESVGSVVAVPTDFDSAPPAPQAVSARARTVELAKATASRWVRKLVTSS